MQIEGYSIDTASPVFIIAELSANHAQKMDVAIQTIRAAKRAGADAVKLQTYTPDTLTIDCDNEYFQIGHGTLWDGRTLYDLYKEAYTPWEWHEELFRVAREEGLIILSTPFDRSAVDMLESLNAPAYKIASFEIQDIPLIRYVATKGKPIIISTGIATLEDIELAVKTCRQAGNNDIVLLKCTSAYPAPLDLANLRTMVDMGDRFNVAIGLSDHTTGNTAAVVATSLGARIIERHLILDRAIGGPDAEFSLDVDEFSAMVDEIRSAELALGKVSYNLPEKVEKNKKFGRSLFVIADVKKGDVFTEENVRSIRPGYGLHPRHLDVVLGTRSVQDITKGTPLRLEHLETGAISKMDGGE